MILNKMPFNISGLTEANRPIRLRLTTKEGMVDDFLLVKHVDGVEIICGGIEYSLLCVSHSVGMELKQFIANPVELQFVTASGELRTVWHRQQRRRGAKRRLACYIPASST